MNDSADGFVTEGGGAVAIVAHDAGGAEVLSSYVRRRALRCRFALGGPARSVFRRKLGDYENLSVQDAIQGSDGLLCGTSWQSDLELSAIDFARVAGKPSVAWLDHWISYRERFTRSGKLHLPDSLWVGDEIALKIACRLLPSLPVRLVDNPYLTDMKAELDAAQPVYPSVPGKLTILYICEPLSETALRQFGNAMHYGYTEQQAMRYFLDNLDALGAPVGSIVIRPHPAEAAGKYQKLVSRYALPLAFSGGHPLSAEVVSADCVVGCSSMAMVVALSAGKRVISCIPPGGEPCPLPLPGIEMLRDMTLPV